MGEGAGDGFGREEVPVLAEGAEEDAVGELLGEAEDFLGIGGWVVLPEVGVFRVELVGELAANGLGAAQEFVEMEGARVRDHARRAG